ncbi:hypothetical protein HMN09_01358100 [Mycena chlorophos]|uniref:Transcription factor IIIC 90kDa subunit N-terminal domain-containing protein n=1 Tax=Mycena chlorophos TaxID=658473 RepID=A0A8H6RXG2_MYCCL|nr:hypothetical protein HMN09_01358100 [Mycena chlorophos]
MSTIHGTFSIPTVLTRPSTACLQWSADGQIFFLSKTAVYVLTPERGVHSITLPGADTGTLYPDIRYFSTIIDCDPRKAFSWCLASKAFGALSLGSLDVGLRAVVCSPSGLSANASCIAAILSANMDLSLWHSVKNTITGEWVKMCDVPPLIAEVEAPPSRSEDEKILRSQMTCLSWSPHADFDVWPAPSLDSSFLATGTRAGTVNLFRFTGSSLHHVSTVEVADEWVTHVAFSPWKTRKKGESQAALIYGTTSGAVGAVKITQILVLVTPALGFCPMYNIETRVDKSEHLLFPPVKAGITALACIHPQRHAVVVRATPGVISLWSGSSAASNLKLGWAGHRYIRLTTQNFTVGSSSLHSVSGLNYIAQEDALLVSLSDGTMHIIESLKTEPRLADASRVEGHTGIGTFTSEGVSRVVRTAFKRTDRPVVASAAGSRADVNRVSGFVPFDGATSAVGLWIQEYVHFFAFSSVWYRVCGFNLLCSLQAAEIRAKSPQNEFLNEISLIVNTTKASSSATPLHLLRPVFLRTKDLLELRDALIEKLLKDAERCPPPPEVQMWPGEDLPVATMSHHLTRSLKTYLFGCDVLHSLRLKLAVVDYCWRRSKGISQNKFEEAAQHLLQIISAITMRILCRHLKAIAPSLQDSDAPFVIRIAMQSGLLAAPAVLRADAARLVSSLPPALSGTDKQKAALNQPCLACGAAVDFAGGGGSHTVCPNGHAWDQCAATMFILSTPKVRTCTGCTRKVLIAPSEEDPSEAVLPVPAQSWVVEAFLRAVNRCLFCGNNFAVGTF